jgi:protein arginine kinase
MKGDFVRWAAAPPSWITSFDVAPVVSSRARLARNLAGLPFPHNAPASGRKQVLQQVFTAVRGAGALEKAQTLTLATFSSVERSFLIERQLMSHQHAADDGDRGLVVAPGESLSIMVNEEDHLRAAAFRAGLDLWSAWESLAGLDDELGDRLPMAFDNDFGYIAACPTNMGSGLRASCLLHLPALALSNGLATVLASLAPAGLTARGFYGEGTSSVGDLVQISNTRTLGVAESSIVRDVEKAVRQIVAMEAKAASDLMNGDARRALEDRVYRGFGTLKSARLLDYIECMRSLSLVRFGLRLGLSMPVTAKTVNELMFLSQPAHLRLRAAKAEAKAADAAMRADFVRERLRRSVDAD